MLRSKIKCMQQPRIWSCLFQQLHCRIIQSELAPIINIVARQVHDGKVGKSNATAGNTFQILDKTYTADSWTNVTPRIISNVGRNLHNEKYHPLRLIKQRITNYFYANFTNRSENPIFAVFDNINPVVTTHQNFDSLLIPKDHPSRAKSDTYYVNKDLLLRSQTSAHQEELIVMGFDSFLVVGDVYRRDAIDATHYPVFHQMEGVRLFTESEVFSGVNDPTGLTLFEDPNHSKRTADKQESHTLDAAKLLEYDLKNTLSSLAHHLFGDDIQYRWVDCYFPFTHPSWELEILYKDEWLEVLGCGIMEQKILVNAGAKNKIGWAFGLGLERLAMKLYQIPDIRLFWSKDSGFLNQFQVENPETPITYKPVSTYPQCANDLSFWIPEGFTENDFYDLVRSVGGDIVEQVLLVDTFKHPKHQRTSHCYRIIYRHMERTLTQKEVNDVHSQITHAAVEQLGIEPR